MIKLPKTLPIPAPDPATPTVAAPAPMNLAAESMSRLTSEVWIDRAMGDALTSTSFERRLVFALTELNGRAIPRQLESNYCK